MNVEKIIAQGKPWTDSEFPPELSSLYDPQIDRSCDANLFQSLTWKRASEIYQGQNPQIFADGIEPNDINQGSLGDCYFLAVLSSLAEFPHRISDMFVTKDLNAAGIYMVKFYINGIQHPVIVDDYLPCHPDGRPAFATSRDAELWVCILEKAWAKLHGSYARTEGGLPCFAASHLTGVPSESISHASVESKEDFFDLLLAADKRNFTMMAASHGQGEVTS